MKRELDTADRKIVELLQEDARLPLKSIADKVSLTSPTVSARIDRLEKDGVITGYRASVNPEVFDYRIKAFINLEVEPVRNSARRYQNPDSRAGRRKRLIFCGLSDILKRVTKTGIPLGDGAKKRAQRNR